MDKPTAMRHDDQMVKREYRKGLLPMILSVLGGTVNTFVDSLFVSNVIGASALAAINLCLPIYLIICTFGSLLGNGAGTLSAKYLGKENVQRANEYYNLAFWLIIIGGGCFTLVTLLFSSPIALGLSQGTELYGEVLDYGRISFLATIPNCFIYFLINYLQLEGKNREISNVMYLMIATDVVLDALLLIVFPLGMTGAALASLFSLIITCIYGFYKLEKGFSNYKIKSFSFSREQNREILVTGSSFAMSNFCDTLKTFFLNSFILAVWGTNAVALLAIVNAISEIAISISFGVPAAAGALLGVFYSARENESIRGLIKAQYYLASLLALGFGLLVVLFQRPIAYIFAAKDSLLFPMICLAGFCILDTYASILNNYYNKTDFYIFANFVTMIRRLFAPVLAAYVVYLLEIELWYYLPLMSAITLIIILFFAKMVAMFKSQDHDEHQLSGILLLDDYLTKTNRMLDFSVEPEADKICTASEQISEFCQMNHMQAKLTMKLQMAIEEILTVYAEKNEGKLGSVDLRAYVLPGNIGIRIRCGGIPYNAFDANDEEDDLIMGVVMIRKLADVVNYTYTLGLNNINIIFDNSAHDAKKGES